MVTDPLQLRNPIVLIHGLGARSHYGPVDYFYGLPPLLRAAGNQLLVANLKPWGNIDFRSKQLRAQIHKAFPDAEKVNLVGHSMGGLDARFLASQKDFSDRVASVTTIGTPNRGSVAADLVLKLVESDGFLKVRGGFGQISARYCTEIFNREFPDAENVAYFSATSSIPEPIADFCLPFFRIPYRIIKRYQGDNDGFVAVESAVWGEHICTYLGDHYAQIGQLLGKSRGMDYMAFYEEIITHLKKRGM
jgi:triacylglycerol lipase